MASPASIIAANARRADRVAELASAARQANPTDTLDKAWSQIAAHAEPGGVAADDPISTPVTFRQAVSRWYENTPGGFDAAVESSQKALREHGVVYPHSNSPAYGMWEPQDVDKRTAVKVNWALGPFDSRGTYSNDRVLLNPAYLDAAPKGRNPTLEHELTHAMLDKTRPVGLLRGAHWQNGFQRFDRTPPGSVTLAQNPVLAERYAGGGPDALDAERRLRPLVDAENYVMQRAELDPRIAEVRRRYAFYTGQDVVTPEDAARAWDWWRANREWLEDLSTPTDTPSMTRSQFDTYNSLPEESKSIMFRRMTQVPAIMAPIAAGGAASQQEGGILDGLRDR